MKVNIVRDSGVIVEKEIDSQKSYFCHDGEFVEIIDNPSDNKAQSLASCEKLEIGMRIHIGMTQNLTRSNGWLQLLFNDLFTAIDKSGQVIFVPKNN